ncbi:MAG: hypothetical protein ABIA37_00340 [Candidatus Woesearchaeota archaeon]
MKKKRKVSWLKEHKIIVIVVLVLLVIFLSFFGTKIFLYIKLAVGNDIIVGLAVDQEDFNLKHNEEGKIIVEAKVTTNPFCKAVCNYKFLDISRKEIIEEQDFNITPTTPFRKEYSLKAERLGSGLELYRFDLDCHSLSTFFCHTTEEPATRSVLVTVKYGPTLEEEQLQGKLKQLLDNYSQRVNEMDGKMSLLLAAEKKLADHVEINFNSTNINMEVNALQNKLLALEKSWPEQDLTWLEENTGEISLEQIEADVEDYYLNLTLQLDHHNQQLAELEEIRDDLVQLQNSSFPSPELAEEIEPLSTDFNQLVSLFNQIAGLDLKEKNLDDLAAKLDAYLTPKLVLEQELTLAINQDLLCSLGGECFNHSTVGELAVQEEFDLNRSCQKRDNFLKQIMLLNQSLEINFTNQSYPAGDEFWQGIEDEMGGLKKNTTLDYLSALPENGTNTGIIKEFLGESNISNASLFNYSGYDLFPASIKVFLEQLPTECQMTPATLSFLAPVSSEPIELEINLSAVQGLDFNLPTARCCVFEDCADCCATAACESDPQLYPVLFLHGHALSQGTSAEFSLEGFNAIQKKLEEDGFLNAGTITLYTDLNSPAGVWGLPAVPLTIRGSYYFDVFKQPDNYYLVQTKSENIDTYAIRLKELIEIVKYKTGKPKVNIVAFSMGGLVARRNLQIFGTEDVNKLVMIGTPNHGVTGTIAGICSFTGAELECRDLQADSLFINKLNSGKQPNIPVYNIVGTGCEMDDGVGDGAVLEKSAKLDWATNFIIKGKCRSAIAPLHLDLREPQLYPEVYQKLKEVLEE